jgi:hypothetical protein
VGLMGERRGKRLSERGGVREVGRKEGKRKEKREKRGRDRREREYE